MGSEVYLDTVGAVDRVLWPPSYNGVIDRRCTRCHAEPYELCINPATGRGAKAPCLVRGSLN